MTLLTPRVSLDCGCGCRECTEFCTCDCPLCKTLRRARRSGEWPDSSLLLLRSCTSRPAMRAQRALEAAVAIVAVLVFWASIAVVALGPRDRGPGPRFSIEGGLPPPPLDR